ncbi:hypothetical protein BH09VER1_BH09VER1_49450 [soil metagenome]
MVSSQQDMKSFPRHQAAISRVELLVALVIGGLAFFLLVPQGSFAIISSLHMGQAMQILSNMKQLQLATEQMAHDGATNSNPRLGWPGDTGATATNWIKQLVSENYLSTNDMIKLLNAPRESKYRSRLFSTLFPPPARKTNLPTSNDAGVLVYAVSAHSPEDAVFLTSANFTNSPTGGAMDSSQPLFRDKYFVVMRKDGSGFLVPTTEADRSQRRTDGMYYTNGKTTQPIGNYEPLCR